MSAAANNWLKDRPLITVLFSFLGSLILAFTVRAVNIDDEEKKALKDKIDNKADIEYVDNSISIHEIREQKIIEPIQQNIQELKAEDKLIRVEFLEEVRLLRKDIMDIYKNSN